MPEQFSISKLALQCGYTTNAIFIREDTYKISDP